MRRGRGILIPGLLLLCGGAWGQTPALPLVEKVSAKALLAQVAKVREALDGLGAPLPPRVKAALDRAARERDGAKAVRAVQTALDPLCLLMVTINPESRVKVAQGRARPELVAQEWRTYLVKVQNEAGATAPLQVVSPNAIEAGGAAKPDARHRWLRLRIADRPPMPPTLSGLGLEYRFLQLSSRDTGRREARLSLHIGQGTQDIGFRNDVDILFRCLPRAAGEPPPP